MRWSNGGSIVRLPLWGLDIWERLRCWNCCQGPVWWLQCLDLFKSPHSLPTQGPLISFNENACNFQIMLSFVALTRIRPEDVAIVMYLKIVIQSFWKTRSLYFQQHTQHKLQTTLQSYKQVKLSNTKVKHAKRWKKGRPMETWEWL